MDVNKTGHHIIKLDNSLHTQTPGGPYRVTGNFPPYFPPFNTYKRQLGIHNQTSGDAFDFIDVQADKHHMYHRVETTNSILRILNVKAQLVITLPHELGLKVSRFYLVILGRGTNERGVVKDVTYGNLYFRQDQTHIDLFVFFSVFFSSFFLFLAMCVLLWKLKQAVDSQRSRRERAKEMTLMASRPFARVLLHIEPESMPFVSTPIPSRRLKLKFTNQRNPHLPSLPPVEALNFNLQPIVKPESPFIVVPMATEPTEDGQASVRTVMLQLPGGGTIPTKLCLGSALTTNHKSNTLNTKSSRRRPSSTVC